MAKKTAARKSAPARSNAAEQGDYNPFLKASDIDGPSRFTMTGWTRRLRGKFGPQISVEVEDDNGKKFDFAFGVGSPNHRKFFDALGNDETQWGTTSFVVKVQKSRKDQPFLSVVKVGGASSSSRRQEPIEDEDIPF